MINQLGCGRWVGDDDAVCSNAGKNLMRILIVEFTELMMQDLELGF